MEFDKRTVGVIVGRFQTSRLTPGHVHLINTALLQNDEVILLIGDSPLRNSVKQPIPFVWRASMIQMDRRIFCQGKNFHILPIKDVGSDKVWAASVQREITKALSGNRLYFVDSIRLYGSRDSSFLRDFTSTEITIDRGHPNLDYKVACEKVELLPFSNFSATELRKQVADKYPGGEQDEAIREGMVIASQMRYPMVVSTVDVALLQKVGGVPCVWLGRKPNSDKYRFIGGFAEPTSQSDEEDALREAEEETGLIADRPAYIGSTLIDDWRFRGEKDQIRTRFFAARVIGGEPEANDDIAAIKPVPLHMIAHEELVVEHGPLGEMFKNWLKRDGLLYLVENLK